MREKGGQFEERKAVLGKNVERIPQELVRARSEGIEVPPFPEDLGEFGDSDKSIIRRLFLKRIDTDGGPPDWPAR